MTPVVPVRFPGAMRPGYVSSPSYAAYRRANIRTEFLRVKSSVLTGGLNAPMDFVVGNGVAVQLAHTWSFQIQSLSEVTKDIKSWGFTLERLLRDGGAYCG